MQFNRYQEYERDKDGYITMRHHTKYDKQYGVQDIIKEKKPEKLSYWERRKPEHTKGSRNYKKFCGYLPSFRQFDKVPCKQVIKPVHFKQKRFYINIIEWLSAYDLMIVLSKVCKKFYMLSWDEELLKKVCLNGFGYYGYILVKYKCAKAIYNSLNNIKEEPIACGDPDEDDKRSSEYWTSDDENEDHIRQDQCDSADDENDFKDYIRRNAREEEEVEREVKRRKREKYLDFQKIDKCKANNEPIPQELKEKYKEELLELRQNTKKQSKNLLLKKNSIIDQRAEKKLQEEKERQRAFKKIEKEKIEFTKQYIPNDNIEFKRKLLLVMAARFRCFNCNYIGYEQDEYTKIAVCMILKKAICEKCKMSDAFNLISATSAAKRYKVDKKDIDMLKLPSVESVNPYYTAQKMLLYYEFMIKENIPKILEWRAFKKQKQHELLQEHYAMKKSAKFESQTHQTILNLEIEFRRNRDSKHTSLTRDEITNKYINHPLMTRFIEGKTTFYLLDIVEMIDSGKADKLEERMAKKEFKDKQEEYDRKQKKIKDKVKKQQKDKEKESKKKQKMKKKEIEEYVLKKRLKEQNKSSMSGKQKSDKKRDNKKEK